MLLVPDSLHRSNKRNRPRICGIKSTLGTDGTPGWAGTGSELFCDAELGEVIDVAASGSVSIGVALLFVDSPDELNVVGSGSTSGYGL